MRTCLAGSVLAAAMLIGMAAAQEGRAGWRFEGLPFEGHVWADVAVGQAFGAEFVTGGEVHYEDRELVITPLVAGAWYGQDGWWHRLEVHAPWPIATGPPAFGVALSGGFRFDLSPEDEPESAPTPAAPGAPP